MSALTRPLGRLYHALLRPFYLRRYRQLALEHVDGVPLVILPDVFNPVLMRAGAFLARTLAALPPAPNASRALDMGTGCGVAALFAARRGYRVLGVDISPAAVRCARINVLLNQLEDRVDIRQGDLFAPVAGERFDLAVFNPPFYRGQPKDDFDRAWRAADVFERFAAGLPDALQPGGRALVVLSTTGDGPQLLAALRANRFEPKPVARRNFGNELLTVYSVER
jgi:release factor glutamine methyltransferase